MGGGDEEDDRKVILEVRFESNTRPFEGNLDDQGGISRSTEANQNMTRRSFRSRRLFCKGPTPWPTPTRGGPTHRL